MTKTGSRALSTPQLDQSPGLAQPGELFSQPLPEDRVGARHEQMLWHRWRGEGESAAREALIELHLPYARALAARSYTRRVHNAFEFEEYFHFAVVGMMEALERFSPERGVQFKTFATTRINGAILNGLETLSEQQQQVALRQRLARERVQSLAVEAPLDHGEQLLRELGEIGIGLALGFILEGTGMMAESQASMPDNAYADMETKQLRQQLWRLVEQLTTRESQVLRMHYLQQQGFDEIGVALRLTKGRISQLHRQGLERLRKLMMEPKKIDVAL